MKSSGAGLTQAQVLRRRAGGPHGQGHHQQPERPGLHGLRGLRGRGRSREDEPRLPRSPTYSPVFAQALRARCLQKALPSALAWLLFPGSDCEVPRVASLRGEGGADPAGSSGLLLSSQGAEYGQPGPTIGRQPGLEERIKAEHQPGRPARSRPEASLCRGWSPRASHPQISPGDPERRQSGCPWFCFSQLLGGRQPLPLFSAFSQQKKNIFIVN